MAGRRQPAKAKPSVYVDANGHIVYDLTQREAPPRRGAVSGRDFILEIPADPPSLWGDGNRVAWAEGEGLMIYAPQGVGKTSLAQQLVNARIGVGPPELLGLGVEPGKGKLLYLAMDRPPQIARSWRRMVGAEDSEALAERVVVWQGPLPFKLTPDEPGKLVRWAIDELGISDAVVIDSYKNLAPSLSDERTGAMIDSIAQETMVEGLGWVALHHGRKANADNKKPNTLDDVYGNVRLTAGMGSVLCLWGKPGDAQVELSHLKQPAEPVGPMLVLHDHATGRSTAVSVPPGSKPRDRAVVGVFVQRGGLGTTLTLKDLRHLGDDKYTREALARLVEDGVLRAEGHTTNKTWTLVRG
ncbi:MAG TPA: AAA family ATPase [Terriglobia bacterium]|nr:AAA family ATPase [Terriglobia bacterium]